MSKLLLHRAEGDIFDLSVLGLVDWIPMSPEWKGGGVWSSGLFTDGTQMVGRNWNDVIDTFEFAPSESCQDDIYNSLDLLYDFLEQAVSYWMNPYQNSPVWLEVQGDTETNRRYAVIKAYSIPSSDNPFEPPFGGRGYEKKAIENFSISITHEIWRAHPIGTSECLQLTGAHNYRIPVLTTSMIFFAPTQGADDVYVQHSTLSIDTSSNDAKFGGDYSAGIRFRNVTIPQGSVITDAYVTLESYDNYTTSNTVRVLIYAEKDSNPLAFSSYADFMNRERTTNYSKWLITAAWTAGSQYSTPEMKDIIQEIINQPDWVSGGNIVIFLDGNNVQNDRSFSTMNNVPAVESELHVSYLEIETRGNQDATCEPGAVYVSNHYKETQISNAYYYDASGASWSTDLIGAGTPFNLLPAVPASGDYLLIGSADGPFSSAIFDLLGGNGLSALDLEYWNGAYVNVPTFKDNTESFMAGGTCGIFWRIPNDWVSVADGPTAQIRWWIKIDFTYVAGNATPQQQNRDIYTVSWNDALIDGDDIAGNIPALLSAILNRDTLTVAESGFLTIDNVYICTRSQNRGIDFIPYLNTSQLPVGITGAVESVDAALVDNATANQTYSSEDNSILKYIPSLTTEVLLFTWTFDENIAWQYIGEFDVFVRYLQDGGNDYDYGVRLQIQFGGTQFYTSFVYLDSSPSEIGKYMGRIKINANMLAAEELSEGLITITAICLTAGITAGDLYIFDLILIPVDEFGVKIFNIPTATEAIGNNDYYYEIDSCKYPKQLLGRFMSFNNVDDRVFRTLDFTANAPLQIQYGKDQRIFFIMPQRFQEESTALQVEFVERFLLGRGKA